MDSLYTIGNHTPGRSLAVTGIALSCTRHWRLAPVNEMWMMPTFKKALFGAYSNLLEAEDPNDLLVHLLPHIAQGF